MGVRVRGPLTGMAALLVMAGCEWQTGGEPERMSTGQPVVVPEGEERNQTGAGQQARWVRGQVTSISGNEVRVAARNGEDVRMLLTPETTVLVDGRPATAATLREGSEVRASYGEAGGEPVALLVEVDRLDAAPPLQPEPLPEPRVPILEETQQLPLDQD